jgi:hypothetical protein
LYVLHLSNPRLLLGEGYRFSSSSLCTFPYLVVASFILGKNIFLRTFFSNANQCSAFRERTATFADEFSVEDRGCLATGLAHLRNTDPTVIVRLEGLGPLKNRITSTGIEPAAFRHVA